MKKTLMILTMAAMTTATNADPDWSKVDAQSFKIFYPGVSSWGFLTSPDHGTGEKPVMKNKKSCSQCHISKKGEYDISADKIISGTMNMTESGAPLEPKPLKGMPGYVDINVKAAYDDEYVYLSINWPSAGTSFKDASLADQGLADKLSVQLTNGSIKSFGKSGCFITCHDSLKDMPGDDGSGKKLYAAFTEKKGKKMPEKLLNNLISKGRIIDQWVVSFKGADLAIEDQYILQDRMVDDNNLEASGSFADGGYTVNFKRKLNTGDSGDVVFTAGKKIDLSIAIHENKLSSRFHYTSFPISVGLGAKKVDISAVKL